MEKLKNLKAEWQKKPNILTLNSTETFEEYFKYHCMNCACKNYCTQKDLCCYLHTNNLPITGRFICRLEKLYQITKYYVENALINEHWSVSDNLADMFREVLPSLRLAYLKCFEELKSNNDKYTITMLNTLFKNYLFLAGNERFYNFLYGNLEGEE